MGDRRPPRVGSPSKRKSKPSTPKPWYRHAPWVLPTLVCMTFAVLIAGAVGVRRVIIVMRAPPPASPVVTPPEPPPSAPVHSEPDPPVVVETTPPVADDTAEVEHALDILPPPAAKEPGRKLPRTLLVGPGPNMFPGVAEAMQYVISGDVIEIDTNGPLLVGGVKLAADDKQGVDLTIRAGAGFQPVLRSAADRMFEFHNARVLLEQIHFATCGYEHPKFIFTIHGGELTAQACSYTLIRGTQPYSGLVSFVSLNAADEDTLKQTADAADPRVKLENCFIRSEESILTVEVSAPQCTVHEINCLIVGGHGLNVEDYRSVEPPPETGRRFFLEQNTILGHVAAVRVRGLQYDPRTEIVATGNVVDSIVGPIQVVPSSPIAFFNGSFADFAKLSPPQQSAVSSKNIEIPSLADSAFSWRGRRNRFSFDMNRPDASMVFVRKPPITTLAQWNAFWGGPVETDSVLTGTPPFPGFNRQGENWQLSRAAFQLPLGPAASAADSDVQIGCDVTRLPEPPPITLQPYQAP